MPLYLTRHLTTRDSQPMIHQIDRDLCIRQTRSGIERPHSIMLNVGCDKCGSAYLSSFYLFLSLFLRLLPAIDRERRRERLCTRKKRRIYRTKVKRTGRHDTRNKASGCSRFGIISDITLQRNGRDTERLLAAPCHGIEAPRSGRAYVRACVHMHMRAYRHVIHN